ncbi:MAG: SEL1-like repeat protein, partial [Caulobacterales bacterium]|nr:SEL1-like repeat protein [Caulobacterales bacterium]
EPDDVVQVDGADSTGLLRRAEAGDAEAQFQLGSQFAHGTAGCVTNPVDAARWCEAAAQQGHGKAQFNLGLLLLAGESAGPKAEIAARWLRLAAANGIAEATGCLELANRLAEGDRPRSWDAAATRASVALEHTDPQAPKALRLAEYYVDPCLDLLINRYRIQREQAEDIVQQFFLELEEPLTKGEHRGIAWKRSLRERFIGERGSFRGYLATALVNFSRDWFRRERSTAATAEDPIRPAREAERYVLLWSALLQRWSAAVGPRSAQAARACQTLDLHFRSDLGQAEIAARLGLSMRSISNAMRLGAELLESWLREILLAPPGVPERLHAPVEAALAMLPDWLFHANADKRTRVKLFLALAERILEARGAGQGK